VHWGTLAQYWRSTEIGDIVEDGEYLAMDYAATALAGVISVARKVMTHEERIAALEAENERLRNEIENLKAA
jgi:cell division protein FtsB